jgi:predicted nucleic acid-binding protein
MSTEVAMDINVIVYRLADDARKKEIAEGSVA